MNNRIKGGVLVLLGAISFGFLSTIVKFAYENGFTVGEITGTQSFSGMVILWIAYWFTTLRKKKGGAADGASKSDNAKSTTAIKTAWWKVAVSGIFTGLVGIFYYQCVELLPASMAIILLMQYLWISVLIEAVVFKKRPSKKQIILLGVVFAGTFLAGGIFSEEVVINIEGIGYGLLAAACYSVFLIASGRIGNDLPVLKKSALMITGSCATTWLIFPPLFFFNGVYFGGLFAWGLVLALLGTVIPPLFFSYGIPRVGVSISAILSAVELPTATLSSALILNESVDFIKWVGVALILLSIVATNVRVGGLKE